MKQYTVEFKAGESRTIPGKGVDYMMAQIDDVELYAEAAASDDEIGAHDSLKAEIIEQAARHGIGAKQLKFYYD